MRMAFCGIRPPKRLIFGVLTGIVVLLTIELISYLALAYLYGKPVFHGYITGLQRGRMVAPALELSLQGLLSRGAEEFHAGQEVAHPFVGSVRPAREKQQERGEAPECINYGFPQSSEQIFFSESDSVIIAIFGGSLARYFWPRGTEAMLAEVRSLPEFSGRDVVILNFGMLGYKQPQQLMTLNYFLALGAHFDFVINIDGYNELFMPATVNAPMGIFPFYPRRWAADLSPLDPGMRAQIGLLTYLREKRMHDAEHFSTPPLNCSLTAGLWWTLLDRTTTGDISECLLELEREVADSLSYTARGPERVYAHKKDMWKDFADVWRSCSRQMNYVCDGLGIRYYHFLQPNQYVRGSKSMGDFERRLAIRPNSRYAWPAREGYPYLRASGRELKREGVPFYDMTRVFETIEATVYRDICCHLNGKGNRILGAAIGKVIARDFERNRVRR